MQQTFWINSKIEIVLNSYIFRDKRIKFLQFYFWIPFEYAVQNFSYIKVREVRFNQI